MHSEVTHLRNRIHGKSVPEIVESLDSLEKGDRIMLFRSLPRDTAADVFAQLDPGDQDKLLDELGDRVTREILERLEPDERTALFEELPAEVTTRLMGLLNKEDFKETMWLLGYPQESIGRLMTPDYIAVKPHWSVAHALSHIRQQGRAYGETISRVFVTDTAGKLLDDIKLQRFILAEPDATVEQIMDYSFVCLSAFDDREEAVRIMKKYNIASIAILDSQGILIGIVTIDDMLDVAEQEVTEDIHKSASLSPLERQYSSTGPLNLYKKRIGWLTGLVLMNTISAGIITYFEHRLSATIGLVAFIPILLGTGGNVGAQSATLIIRALVTQDIEPSEWVRALVKECVVGLLLGLSLAILIWIISQIKTGTGMHAVELGVTVAFTMVAIVVVANILGVVFPFILSSLRIDPAIASTPLITTLADATGLIIYFSVANAIF